MKNSWRVRRGWLVVVALCLWAVTAAGCSGGSQVSGEPDVEDAAEPSGGGDDGVASEAVELETVVGPTLDGTGSVSDDGGLIWTRIGTEIMKPDDARSVFKSIATDPDGSLLIGGDLVNYETSSTSAAVWRSASATDTKLERRDLPTLAPGVSSNLVSLVSVPESMAAGAQGVVRVAAGSVGQSRFTRAAVWAEDATGWTHVESEAFMSLEAEWTHELMIDPGGDSMVLVGSSRVDGVATPVLWRSTDAMTWQRGSMSAFAVGPSLQLTKGAMGVNADGLGVAVIVGHYQPDAVRRSIAWTSVAGGPWQRVEPDVWFHG